MARARNRCLPMNISAENLKNSNIIKDRVKIGSSLADVDPMNVDRTVSICIYIVNFLYIYLAT